MKSLKTRVSTEISNYFEINLLNKKAENIKNFQLFYALEGFANQPIFYVLSNDTGLRIGYQGIKWYGGIDPCPHFFDKHLLTWDNLLHLSIEEQQEIIATKLIKTINLRKRHYKKCQFCGEKVSSEHRIDQNTCHSCASEHLGVVF